MVNEILKTIYASGGFGVPLVIQNQTVDMSAYSIWAKFQIMPTDTAKANLSDTEQRGILQITLFVPIGTGDELVDSKATDIVTHFGTQESYDILGYQTLIIKSHKEPPMPDSDGKHYMQPISIEYEVIGVQASAPKPEPPVDSSIKTASDIQSYIDAFYQSVSN